MKQTSYNEICNIITGTEYIYPQNIAMVYKSFDSIEKDCQHDTLLLISIYNNVIEKSLNPLLD